ncbi:MAG: hypothetical protein V4590_06695 [Bacteroidota bacterium]
MRAFIYIILATTLFSCGQNNQNEKREYFYDFSRPISLDTIRLNIPADSFAQTIADIEKRIVDLTDIEAVFHSDKYIFIYEHASKYLNNVVNFLSDTTLSRQKRMIALLTMNKQDFDNNLNFLLACEKLYKRSLIEEEFLQIAIFPPVLQNRDIIKFYNNKKVQEVLYEIRDNPNTSENFKETINEILSGKRYKEEKAFLKDAEGVDI